MKQCSICHQQKPLSDYYKVSKTRKSPDGHNAFCKACHLTINERNRVKREYGLTMEEYTALKTNGCALCGTTEGTLHIDHDHRNGKVRAALCGSCNRGLGMFHDDPERMEKAAAYIRDWKATHA